jgi:hypothetical protein
MNVDDIIKNPALKKAAVTFASGYARRIMEGQYTRLMNTEVGKQASRLSKPSKYAVEAVLNGIVAWASTKESKFANTPVKEFLWELAKDAPSEISKRLLNGDHAETIDVEVSGEDARTVLDGLLRMDAHDLSTFMSWLEKASPEERHKMAETMSKLTEDEQKKLLALSPEQARALFASTSATQQPAAPKGEGAVRSLTSALRGLNERLEKRKGSL